jgi:hypothetical protein
MNSVRVLLMLVTLLLILVGCNQPAPPAPDESTATPPAPTDAGTEPYPAEVPTSETEPYPDPGPAEADPYPGTNPETLEAYPSPETEPGTSDAEGTAEPFIVPTPSSDEVGNVTGMLLRVTEEGEAEPVREALLYLGPLVTTTEGVEGLARLDITADPQTTLGPQGGFAFTDVEPGRYILWYVAPAGSPLQLRQPDTGEDLVINLDGGEIVDLGELRYEGLPSVT